MHFAVPRSIIAVALLLALISPAWSAGKTTVDPNSVPKIEEPAPEPLWETDKRLDQKIEYDAGNARLHNVVADLAKTSGVTLYCGKNNDDWHVRDIPVTAAVRGLPLRDVLLYLVYATHSQLLARKTDEGAIYYKIVAAPKAEKAADDYAQAVKDYKRSVAMWSLQMASLLKEIPVSAIKPPQTAAPGWWDDYSCYLEASKVLGSMDPQLREAVLSGRRIVVTPRTAPASMHSALISLLKATDAKSVNAAQLANTRAGVSGSDDAAAANADPATPEELESSPIYFAMNDTDVVVYPTVKVKASGGYQTRTSYGSSLGMAGLVKQQNKGKLDLPSSPTYPDMPAVEPPTRDCKPLEWTEPEIPKTVTIEIPKDDKPLEGPDAVIAISKAAGLNIISEDFDAHRRSRDIKPFYSSELTFPSALLSALDVTFLFDSRNKTIIGSDRSWAIQHENLLPEKVILDLSAKANGDGVDIDDLAVLADYPETSVRDWLGWKILHNLPIQSFTDPDSKPLWSFYNALSRNEKSRVKSREGLSLAGLDISPILGCFKSQSYTDPGGKTPEDLKSTQELLTDPAVLPTLVMRLESYTFQMGVRTVDGKRQLVPIAAGESAAGSDSLTRYTTRHGYALVIEGTTSSGTIRHRLAAGANLPYFSPEREKELIEMLAKSAGSNGQVK